MKKTTKKMTPQVQRIMEEQMKAFRKKFGRSPGPNDPVFFDPDADSPQPISEAKLRRVIVHAAQEAGLDPERVLAALGIEK